MANRLAEKAPGWVARILLPEIRSIVRNEISIILGPRSKRVEESFKISVESFEKSLDLVRHVAVLEAKVRELEAKVPKGADLNKRAPG